MSQQIAAGLDPSLTRTGIALSDGSCGHVGQIGVTKLSVREQIRVIDRLANDILYNASPDEVPAVVVIEGLDMAQSYGGQIERTALWWKLVEQLSRWPGCRVAVAPSPILKMYATGKGTGPKGAVIEAVTRQWPQFAHGGDHNQADAAVAAALGAHLLGQPLSAVTADQERALTRVRWIDDPPPVKASSKKASPTA